MKIHSIAYDLSIFQSLLPVDERIWWTDALNFNGRSKVRGWIPPEVYIRKPKLKRGNFIHLTAGSGCLVFDHFSYAHLRDILEPAGEILPLPFEGEELYILNVTVCVEALDPFNTTWNHRDGVKTEVAKYAFDRKQLPNSSLFKIPETCRATTLTYSGLNIEREFKTRVEKLGLTGLLFKELWGDE